MSLFIEKETDTDFSFDEEALAKEVTDYAIEHEGFPFEAEINLTLTDNDGIHAINKEYRDIDAPTDVLSFPMLSYESAGDFSKLEDDYDDNFNPDTGEIMLGLFAEKCHAAAATGGPLLSGVATRLIA